MRSVKVLITIMALIFLINLPVLAAHWPVELKSEDGEIINPVEGINSDQPYSPHKTCGSCHDYNAVMKGYHFQMGWNVIDDEFNKDKDWILSNGMMGKW